MNCSTPRARRAVRSSSVESRRVVRRRLALRTFRVATVRHVKRPSRFEHHRYVGDKRTALVYDLDTWEDAAVVEEFVDLGVGIGFAPDTLAEARNRGYRLATSGSRRIVRTARS
jgi:hypothetical protein